MKKIIGVATIILILCGSAVAADYWRVGVGVRGESVIPGGDHKTAYGSGIIVSFGDPDSRFATQIEVDAWEVTYTYDGDIDNFYYLNDDGVLVGFKRTYAGFGIGLYEKVGLYDLMFGISSYAIGGMGGYFLELKQEEVVEPEPGVYTTDMRSKYLHARFMAAGGIGFDFNITKRLVGNIEGRYVYIESDIDLDDSLIKGFLGLKYSF